MSNEHLDPEPSDKKVLVSALGWIGAIFIFFLVVAVAYLPNRAVDSYQIDADARYEIRNTIRGEQSTLVNGYQWVNQEEGVVRIPIERAMRITVEELRAANAGSATPEG
jgi:hypothetical protein